MKQYQLLGLTLELSDSLPLDSSWEPFLADREAPEADVIRVMDLPQVPGSSGAGSALSWQTNSGSSAR